MELESPEVWRFQCFSTLPALENVSGARTTKHKCFRWSFIWASGGWDSTRKSTQLHAWRTWILVSWLNYPPVNYNITPKRRFWVHNLPAFPFRGICFLVSWRVYNCFWYPLTFDHAPMTHLDFFCVLSRELATVRLLPKAIKAASSCRRDAGPVPFRLPARGPTILQLLINIKSAQMGNKYVNRNSTCNLLYPKVSYVPIPGNKLFNLNTPNLQFLHLKDHNSDLLILDDPQEATDQAGCHVLIQYRFSMANKIHHDLEGKNYETANSVIPKVTCPPQIYHWCNKS